MNNPGMQVIVKTNALPIAKRIKAIGSKQLPFATARALTWTGKDAQKDVRDRLPDTFVERRKWIRGGIIITPANKRTLTAKVGSRDYFMELHATGGLKKPKHKHNIAIPKYGSITEVKVRSRRKRDPVGKRKPFYVKFSSGQQAIVRRRRIKKRYPLEIIRWIEPTADIKKRWPFEDQVWRTIQKKWPRLFEKSFDDALRTAK